MRKIAILASDNLLPGSLDPRKDSFELTEEMEKLTAAFAAQDIHVDLLPWQGISEVASQYEAVLPLLVWDYFEGKREQFLGEMARTSQLTQVFNNYEILAWNSDKEYLDDLKRRGAPVIEAVTIERVNEANVNKAIETLGAEEVVIKPVIGGGAWRQILYRAGDPLPAKDQLPPEGALVQAFLPSVTSEGEYSFVYFGGGYSHAVRKLPKDGDYRIQSVYGGREETYIPSSSERAVGRAVLDSLEVTPLYARVDLLRDLDGQLKLIELELVEPYLYLTHAPGEGAENKGAQKLVEAVLKRLDRAKAA